MNLYSDTTPAPSVETPHRPMSPSPRCAEEKIAAADFYNLLDAPVFSTENALSIKSAAEEIGDISTEASAWLALNTTEFIPVTPAQTEPVNAVLSTAQIPISTLEAQRTHPASAAEERLSPTSITSEIAPLALSSETQNIAAMPASNATVTEILANNPMPMALSSAVLPSFSLAEAPAVNAELPIVNVQRPHFEQNIATHLTWCADHAIGRAHIRVSPPHLGAIEVQLDLRDKQLHAAFFSPHTEVCQRLQESLPMLHRLLDEHGLHLAHADVNQHAPDSHTHTPSTKPAELSAVKENTAPAHPLSETSPYLQTTLLDTWA